MNIAKELLLYLSLLIISIIIICTNYTWKIVDGFAKLYIILFTITILNKSLWKSITKNN